MSLELRNNVTVNRKAWTFAKPRPDIEPVPYTLAFEHKPLYALGKHLLEKARRLLNGDQKKSYVVYELTNLYAAVASHDSIRMYLLIAACQIPEAIGVLANNLRTQNLVLEVWS